MPIRNGKASSVRHTVDLDSPGGTFYYTARIKLLNEIPDEFPMGHTIDLAVSYRSEGNYPVADHLYLLHLFV